MLGKTFCLYDSHPQNRQKNQIVFMITCFCHHMDNFIPEQESLRKYSKNVTKFPKMSLKCPRKYYKNVPKMSKMSQKCQKIPANGPK